MSAKRGATTFFITTKDVGFIVTLLISGMERMSWAKGDTWACLKSLISCT